MLSVTVVKKPPTAEKIIKQLRFGAARGITWTVKEIQASIQKAYHANFTIRNKFLEVGPLAIKVTTANMATLTGSVHTAADFLPRHETGGIKTGRGGHRIAVPTDNVRRTKRQIIQKGDRPKGLRPKGSFVIKTRRGEALAIRRGRGKKKPLTILYYLKGSVRIKKQATFFPVAEKVARRRLNLNVAKSSTMALQTIK